MQQWMPKRVISKRIVLESDPLIVSAFAITCRKVIIMHEGAQNGRVCAESAGSARVLKMVIGGGFGGKDVAESVKMRGNIKIFSCGWLWFLFGGLYLQATCRWACRDR